MPLLPIQYSLWMAAAQTIKLAKCQKPLHDEDIRFTKIVGDLQICVGWFCQLILY